FPSSAGILPTVATAHACLARVAVLRSRGCLVPRRAATGLAAGRPELPGAALGVVGVLFPRGPQLLAGLGLLDADRLGLRDQQLDRLTGRHLLAHPVEATGLAQALEQLVHRGSLTLGARLKRLADLLVGRLDVLRFDDRGEDGFAL